MSLDADELSHALSRRPIRTRGGFMVPCPAHDDRGPSLSITQRGDLVLVHCFAGCTQREVIEALRARGLWPERERRELSREERRRWARDLRDAERLAADVADWALGLERLLELLKEAAGCDEELANYASRLWRLQQAMPAATVRGYLKMRAANPRNAAALVRHGREDRQHALMVTRALVDILTKATPGVSDAA